MRGGLPERGSRYTIPGSLSPLLYASRDGRLDAAKILVAAKADVELADANGHLRLRLDSGRTVAFTAVAVNRVHVTPVSSERYTAVFFDSTMV